MRRLVPAVTAIWLAVWLATPAAASCRDHRITPPGQVRLGSESALIVVHQSSSYDARLATKRGVDEAVRFAKRQRMPVIYLQDESPDEYYFMDDCAPDYWVFSAGGEIGFDVSPSHVYVIGGHLELCLATALNDMLVQWAKGPRRDRTMTFFMDAIYSNGSKVDPSDPFYADFDRFMRVVTHGRPAGEHWPKLSLLETMGIIASEPNQLEYIKQVLPPWQNTMPDEYRIEVRLNDSVAKVLRSAPGWHPPTLRFDFVNSAVDAAQPSILGQRR